MWNLVANILPLMENSTYRALENAVNWENHEETEEELKVYTKKK